LNYLIKNAAIFPPFYLIKLGSRKSHPAKVLSHLDDYSKFPPTKPIFLSNSLPNAHQENLAFNESFSSYEQKQEFHNRGRGKHAPCSLRYSSEYQIFDISSSTSRTLTILIKFYFPSIVSIWTISVIFCKEKNNPAKQSEPYLAANQALLPLFEPVLRALHAHPPVATWHVHCFFLLIVAHHARWLRSNTLNPSQSLRRVDFHSVRPIDRDLSVAWGLLLSLSTKWSFHLLLPYVLLSAAWRALLNSLLLIRKEISRRQLNERRRQLRQFAYFSCFSFENQLLLLLIIRGQN
jgi:hypothetical protein